MLLWLGALLRLMADYRFPKRVMSGELEDTGKRGPRGRRRMDGLRGRAPSHLTLGFEQLYVYGRVGEGTGKGVQTPAEEEGSGRGGQD